MSFGRIILFVFVGITTMACGGAPEVRQLPPMPDLKTMMRSATLGPGDVVEIRVYQEKELSGQFRLGADGTFSYPLVGELKADGISATELSKLIKSRLEADYLREPQVSVFVKEFNSKKVFVLGEVRKPGTFRYEDKMSIVQAVTLAGGLKPLAAKDRLVLTRVIEGIEQKFVVPFEMISEGRTSNVFLQPGDIIFVPESWL